MLPATSATFLIWVLANHLICMCHVPWSWINSKTKHRIYIQMHLPTRTIAWIAARVRLSLGLDFINSKHLVLQYESHSCMGEYRAKSNHASKYKNVCRTLVQLRLPLHRLPRRLEHQTSQGLGCGHALRTSEAVTWVRGLSLVEAPEYGILQFERDTQRA